MDLRRSSRNVGRADLVVAPVTREADQALIRKARRGEVITPEDHIATIDSLDELEGFRRGLAEAGRLTADLLQAIARRKARI